MAYREDLSVGALTEVGIYTRVTGGYIYVLEHDAAGKIQRARGTVAAGSLIGSEWAKGALYTLTSAGSGTHALYENTGTTTTASFDLVGATAAGEITLAEGNVLVGNASGVAAALSAKGDGKVLIGDSTTINSVSLAGDVTVTKTGTTTIGGYKVVTGMLNTGAVTGVKLSAGKGYFNVATACAAAATVNPFGTAGAVVPTALTITDVKVTANDTGTGTITIKNDNTSVAAITLGGTAGVVSGSTAALSAGTSVAATGVITIVSAGTAADANAATVAIVFTVA